MSSLIFITVFVTATCPVELIIFCVTDVYLSFELLPTPYGFTNVAPLFRLSVVVIVYSFKFVSFLVISFFHVPYFSPQSAQYNTPLLLNTLCCPFIQFVLHMQQYPPILQSIFVPSDL